MAGERVDFFISHAGADRAWAEWVAWQLTDAGYSVELDVWDWAAGQNFVTAMSDALGRADRVVALFSAAYFERERYTAEEWLAAAVNVPEAAGRRLVPVRVEDVPGAKVPAILRPLIARDVFGVDEQAARRALLEAVAGPARPDSKPGFPGESARAGGVGPRRPGSGPGVWNVPARNPGFTGRDGLLVAVREAFATEERTVVQALNGMGGVGKTQLAVEYAHRFAGGYDLVWWVNAESPALIGDQFAVLGAELECVGPGAPVSAVRDAVLAELRERGRWLLVFDDAQNPEDIRDWLPDGGHVLVTSRARNWAEVAVPVEVDLLARAESAAILSNRVPGLGGEDAGRLAAALGDLPLALAQAAGYMAGTGTPAGEYLELLFGRAAEVLDQGRSSAYPQSLAAVTRLAFDRLQAEDPAAAGLAAICAFLAPEPVPTDWFPRAVAELPPPLAEAASDPLAWRQVLARARLQALARLDEHGLVMHRLTQAIIRGYLPPGQAAEAQDAAAALLAASHPGDGALPATWPGWARLLPHLLALDPDASAPALSDLTYDAIWYLIRRGDGRSGYDLARHLHQNRLEQFGPDDPATIAAAATTATILRDMGRYAQARRLNEDALVRSRRVLGEDHPSTLGSATNLAADLRMLGEAAAARQLDEDTLARRRRVLGEDHLDTLASATNLAADLSELGEAAAARQLDEDTLARRRRALGEDHPATLASATNLAADLSALGDHESARALAEDALVRSRRVLGEDHPSTLASATNLAADLRMLGEAAAARQLDEDTLARRRRVLGQATEPDIAGGDFRTRGGARPLNEAKFILLGRGGVGKTSLVNRLVHQQFNPKEPRTEGIKVTPWSVDLPSDEHVRLNIWDFGGQEIMHATHLFFLTTRTLYLVVLNGRAGDSDADADYWLQIVQSFAAESPVIVVLNRIAEDPFDLDEAGLRKKFPNIRAFVRTDCAEGGRGRGIDGLAAAIASAADKLDGLRVTFPATWFKIRDRLAGMSESYITFERYREICSSLGESASGAQEELADYLHSLGIALNYRDDPRLRDTHVLNPEWLTGAIYAILNSQLIANQDGEMTFSDLGDILDRKRYPRSRHSFIIELMRRFELCIPYEEEPRKLLITDLLPKQEPAAVSAFQADGALRFEYHYSVLPEGLLPRFIVRSRALSAGQPRWRSGAFLQWGGCTALVRSDRVARIVRIYVTGPTEGRRRLLAVIQSDLEHIHGNSYRLEAKPLVPIEDYPGLAVDYKKLLAAERQKIESLTELHDDKIVKVDVEKALEGVDLISSSRKSQLRLDFTFGRRPAKLFVSYSHKDTKRVDDLENILKLLKRERLVEFWSDRKIGPGDHWKGMINGELEAADVIVLLVSPPFLASDYCIDVELKRALERASDGDCKIVPVIIRESLWKSTSISGLQVLPDGGKPIAQWRDKDAFWFEVGEGLQAVIKEITGLS